VWEEMVKTMKVGEVARFGCEYSHVLDYGSVSKALRQIMKKNRGEPTDDHLHHQCGFSAMASGTGHKDLDDLVANKSPLLFEFELLRVEGAGDYKQEIWQLTPEEKLKLVPKLKEEGNSLYKEGRHIDASRKYEEALGCMEQLMTREKPEGEEWTELQKLRIPLLLNYSQCKLLQEDFAEVIRQTTAVLEYDPDNVKGLYRRAKANASMWNTQEAKDDYERVAVLDPKLKATVHKEIQQLDKAVKDSQAKEKEQLSKIRMFG
jgi:AH receptor-interacting protein